MSTSSAELALPAMRHLPEAVIRSALAEACQRDFITARRLTLLNLLWRESYQIQAGLITRTEARLGRGCFGQGAALAFRRDMQAVKRILAAGGHRLRYSRRPARAGYYIEGHSELAPEVTRAIHGAAAELDPRQITGFAQLTAGQRLGLATRLTADLLTMAVRQRQRERPELTSSAAQQEVLHRAYQLPG